MPLYVPALQISQAVDGDPKYPAAHIVQLEDPVILKVLVKQTEQLVDPVTEVYCPAGHGVQLPAPDKL